MNRSTMLKLMHKINKFYNVLNKYIFIYPLFSIIFNILGNIFKLRDNKSYKLIKNLIKLLILVNIVLAASVILYFTDFETSINNTYSFYYDLLEPYIEMFKALYNKLITYLNNSTIASGPTDSISQIRNEVKAGMKEAISEALNEMDNDAKAAGIDYLKQAALISSGLFFIYFLFILPGTSISTEELVNYNWFNQSLIELKINILNLFNNNSGGPSNSPGGGSPINPSVEIDNYFTPTTVDAAVGGSTPITPTQSNVFPLKSYGDVSTETYLDGITVSKLLETREILERSLGVEEAQMIKDHANNVIKNITD